MPQAIVEMYLNINKFHKRSHHMTLITKQMQFKYANNLKHNSKADTKPKKTKEIKIAILDSIFRHPMSRKL